MTKVNEICDNKSCFNKAQPNEFLFILLDRDKAFSTTIRAWVNERIRLGLNCLEDNQIQEAINLANLVERMQKEK